jgi:hypothetical protein
VTWDDSDADRKNQKRKEALAGKLKQFFGIDEDPIVAEGTGWRTAFAIEPEA